jgi:probable HAF family extracellular repeat protein
VASLLAPGSGWSELESAQAVNNAGQIVGAGYNAAGEYRAYLYSNGVATDLGALGSGDRRFSEAFAINELGQVVGTSTISPTGGVHGFLYSGGTMTDIGALVPGGNCYPTGINDLGQIAGYSTSTQKFHAFLYANGMMTDLGTLKKGRPSFARALNAKGQVVGNAIVLGNGTYHGWIYTDGKMTDLNRLVPKGSPWEITSAVDINNAGVIAANGRDAAGRYRALRLTPVGPR